MGKARLIWLSFVLDLYNELQMIKPYENKFIRTLRNISKNLDNGLRCKHSCMIVRNKKILSVGVNKAKSHPFQKINASNHKADGNPFKEYSWSHAEVSCIVDVYKENLSKATIYVIRADENGNFMESRPCPGCMNLIKKMNIGRVVHSTKDGKIKEILF